MWYKLIDWYIACVVSVIGCLGKEKNRPSKPPQLQTMVIVILQYRQTKKDTSVSISSNKWFRKLALAAIDNRQMEVYVCMHTYYLIKLRRCN